MFQSQKEIDQTMCIFREMALKGTCIRDEGQFVHGCKISNYFIVLRSDVERPQQQDPMTLVVLPAQGGSALLRFEQEAMGRAVKLCCTVGLWHRDILREYRHQTSPCAMEVLCQARQVYLAALSGNEPKCG
jgi:hypothetical protein